MPPQEQDFLRRWSRLKREASAKSEVTGKTEGSAVPAELPSLDALSFESDFRAFMHAEVGEGIRQAALKKLFSDPRFNVMDGLDVYIDDYSKADPIPPGMLAGLQHARTTLLGAQPGQEALPEDRLLAEERPVAPLEGPEPNHGAAEKEAQPTSWNEPDTRFSPNQDH